MAGTTTADPAQATPGAGAAGKTADESKGAAAKPTGQSGETKPNPAPTTSTPGKGEEGKGQPTGGTPAGAGGEEPTYDLKLPKGSQLNAKRVEELAAFAKERKLAPEVAQAILEGESRAVSSYHESQVEAFQKKADDWLEEAKADKEIGGEKFAETVALGKRAIDEFADEEIKTFLDETGFGNNKTVLKFFSKIGRRLANDKRTVPTAAPSGRKSDAELWYPPEVMGGPAKKE